VFEVLFATDALRTAIQQGASASQMAMLAQADGFRPLGERIQAGVRRGDLDPGDAIRAIG
jgi:type II secretory ATPase GspE/PulE/Tfp pilus assembly ATPase PilB-like protein